MANSAGKDSGFKIDDSDGTLQDISTYVKDISFPQTAETHDTTGMGAAARTFIVGLKTSTLSISGIWNDTATTGSDTVLSGIVGTAAGTFNYGPGGTATGDVKYSGECICTSYEESSSLDDAVAFSAEFQVTGAVTRGTF